MFNMPIRKIDNKSIIVISCMNHNFEAHKVMTLFLSLMVINPHGFTTGLQFPSAQEGFKCLSVHHYGFMGPNFSVLVPSQHFCFLATEFNQNGADKFHLNTNTVVLQTEAEVC